jgi:sulfide:quinone oxidoreductase
VGSAHLHQGDATNGIRLSNRQEIRLFTAACEGPPVQMMASPGTWLRTHARGLSSKATVFTPAELIAEDAGEEIAKKLIAIASKMGFKDVLSTEPVSRTTAHGIAFAKPSSRQARSGRSSSPIGAQDVVHELPIADRDAFFVTDPTICIAKVPNVFGARDAAAIRGCEARRHR